MISLRFKSWLAAMVAGLLVCTSVGAADIDLFAGTPPSGANAPNVLIVMDTGAAFSSSNSDFRCNISDPPAGAVGGSVLTNGSGLAANFTAMDKTNGGVEQCALYEVFKSLATGTTTINVGIMFLNNNQAAYDPLTDSYDTTKCANRIGGCLAMKLTPLNLTTAPNILKWIRQWTTSSNTPDNIKGPQDRGDGATMQEAWAYIKGKQGISLRDYSSEAPAAGCASMNIIYLGNNYNSNSSPVDKTNVAGSPRLRLLADTSVPFAQRATPTASITTPFSGTMATGCGTNLGTLPTDENKGAYALNWGAYLQEQGINIYSIAVEQPSGNSCDPTYGAWLNKMGSFGGEFFHTADFAGLVLAFKTVAGKIAAVNSVFAAVSLPVSVNTQGTYLNEIYVGMFRPAQGFLPQWQGNLKQYKLGMNSSGVLRMQDADSALAINSLTGFITECARSFWTPNTVDTYWSAQKAGGCLTVANSTSSNYPDGNIVEKGAQAYKLRAITPANRRVKTCSTSFANCTTLTDFSTANGTVTAALSADLVNWARGVNLDNELAKGTTTMRVTAHGDVVHSRPIPVNHGTDASPQIVVYYGGNDGMLRAVNGNRGSATYTVTGVITSGGVDYEAGSELWSFVPPEVYGNFQRLRDNTTAISTPAMPSNLSTQKQYGVDGPITAFQGTIGGASKVYIYATMRRGGRVVYALDVTTPGSPALLWKKGCPNLTDDTNCSSGYTGIGQTWSSLKSMYAAGYGADTPLMIFGGGYDNCEDFDAQTAGGANHNCTSSTKGNKVYVVNAQTGAIVKAFDTDRAVIADSTLVKDASTGMIKYAYTADMGGNVYRMTFGSGLAATWTIEKIASLGCPTVASCTANRKFMFHPSVVTTDNDTFTLFLGSGDREKPVQSYAASKAVTNYFFSVKDTISAGTAGHTDTLNCTSGTALCLNSLAAIGATNPTQAELDLKPKGWYVALNSASGEQVVTAAVTVFGVVTFSTHQPAPTIATNSCIPNLGTTNVYNISYLNAASANGTANRYEHVSGDGLPPSPVAGQVTLDNGTTVPFCIGCSKDSPLEGAPPRSLSTVTQPTNRLYWYIQK